MAFPRTVNLDYGDEKKESSSAIGNLSLGTRGVTPDGRVFYYAKNSSTALESAGVIVDGIAAVAAHDMDLATTAATAVGSTTISLEVPTTDLTANQYQDGYIVFNDGPGQGEVYRIASHPAHDASDDNTCVFTLTDPGGVRTALTTASLAGLVYNPYTDVKICDGDGTMTTGPLGVSTIPVTASYYCWIQTSGLSSVGVGAQVGVVGDALTLSQETGESGLAERADHSDESDLSTIGVSIGVASVGGTVSGGVHAGDKQLCLLHIRA